jgi:hypothetical protein
MLVIGLISILVFIIALWLVRKAYRVWTQEEPGSPTGFTLGDLRDMRKKGQISEAEYERAKEAIVAAAKRPTTPPPKAPEIGNFQPKRVGFTGGFPVSQPNPRRSGTNSRDADVD